MIRERLETGPMRWSIKVLLFRFSRATKKFVENYAKQLLSETHNHIGNLLLGGRRWRNETSSVKSERGKSLVFDIIFQFIDFMLLAPHTVNRTAPILFVWHSRFGAWGEKSAPKLKPQPRRREERRIMKALQVLAFQDVKWKRERGEMMWNAENVNRKTFFARQKLFVVWWWIWCFKGKFSTDIQEVMAAVHVCGKSSVTRQTCVRWRERNHQTWKALWKSLDAREESKNSFRIEKTLIASRRKCRKVLWLRSHRVNHFRLRKCFSGRKSFELSRRLRLLCVEIIYGCDWPYWSETKGQVHSLALPTSPNSSREEFLVYLKTVM